eukprot:CAMPEP_0170250994 /NCGR_PEP_ID=MMETSP0116_2-20130129/25322_1 /TAXON_ID=400756 /ORGANISM="Durinskia baltica, Strain CSIRO CS-38" /LENGTH=66 /DNA_ID=CAMNT_0010501947 /DNA_START=48 /DNA_END=245 /DNA_ORIENTATION=+
MGFKTFGLVLLGCCASVEAVLTLRGGEQSCEAADLKHRAAIQNKLAGVCEEMCKEVGAYPKCAQCP